MKGGIYNIRGQLCGCRTVDCCQGGLQLVNCCSLADIPSQLCEPLSAGYGGYGGGGMYGAGGYGGGYGGGGMYGAGPMGACATLARVQGACLGMHCGGATNACG